MFFRILLFVVALVVAATAGGVAGWIYINYPSGSGTSAWKAADALVAVGGIALSAVVIKIVLDLVTDRKTEEAERREKERDFLRRMRAAHVQIAYARDAMLGHNSVHSYIEQAQRLYSVKHDLEEIATDLNHAADLFAHPQKGHPQVDRNEIYKAIKEMHEEFIGKLLEECDKKNGELWEKHWDSDLKSLACDDKHGLSRLHVLLEGSKYDGDLLPRSKGRMREYIFGKDATTT